MNLYKTQTFTILADKNPFVKQRSRPLQQRRLKYQEKIFLQQRRQHKISGRPENQQMDRIKHIEKVFRLASPLSVVQRKNQKSRNAANLNPRQKHKQNQRKDRGRPEPLPQKIHHRNYCHAYGPVICPAQFCRRAQNCQKNAERHLSAEDVYRLLLSDKLEIGLATVYRVLTQFEQAGILSRNYFETGKAVFELNEGTHHDHIVCVDCGHVEEFHDDEIEKSIENI